MYRGSTNIGRRAQSLNVSPEFDSYSKVILKVSDEISYEAGSDTGRVLTVECPWGTPQLAQDMLNRLRGFQYQPLEAGNAMIDPAMEVGDGLTIKGVYSGIYNATIKFGSMYVADVSAPEGEALDEEYPYVSATERKVNRKFLQTSSELTILSNRITAEVSERKSDVESIKGELNIQADEISAKVSKTGGDSSSFAWKLTDSTWELLANNQTVLRASKDGLDISGKITALSGTIGGFTIQKDYLSYNGQTWGGTNTVGLYVGTQGIQLGKNFKVDAQGNLTAASGTFEGQVRAGNITYGGSSGTFDGYGLTSGTVTGGWGGSIGGSTITTANTAGGINTSLGYADFANGVFSGWNTAGYVRATYGYFTYIVMDNDMYAPRTYAIPGSDGLTYYINCIARVY